MINYKILAVNPAELVAQIQYTTDGKVPYVTQFALSHNFTEEQLHVMAKEQAHEAAYYWKRAEEAVEFTLASDSGAIKSFIVTNMPPDYDPDSQTLKIVDTEDDVATYRTYVVEEMTPMEKGIIIKLKRDSLLQSTDAESLPDRNPSDELLAYRQALRDVPQQATFPDSVIWPIKPI